MLCRVVARTNADLQRVIDAIVDVAGVERASTVIALATPLPYRVLPLVRSVAAEHPRRRLNRPAASTPASSQAVSSTMSCSSAGAPESFSNSMHEMPTETTATDARTRSRSGASGLASRSRRVSNWRPEQLLAVLRALGHQVVHRGLVLLQEAQHAQAAPDDPAVAVEDEGPGPAGARLRPGPRRSARPVRSRSPR